MTGKQACHHSDEVDRQRAFGDLSRTEIDRGAQVQQEPGVDVTILVVVTDIGSLLAGRDIPVDMTDIVVVLVFTQIRQVQSMTAEKRPVIAVQQPVQSLDNGPLETPQEVLSQP